MPLGKGHVSMRTYYRVKVIIYCMYITGRSHSPGLETAFIIAVFFAWIPGVSGQ